MIVAATPTDLDSLRVRSEFLDLPGLSLNVPQVARMLGLRSEHAEAILETLTDERFLAQTPAGLYHRAMVCQRRPSSPA